MTTATAGRREAAAKDHANGTQAPAPAPAGHPVDRDVPLDRLHPSPLNPRKRFDEAALAELAASIRARGVLQPLVVRPAKAGDGAGQYEVVAGERRYRAARLAGLAAVPCRVVELDDRGALEVMVIENEQRSDVSALEKADGYAALVEGHGVPVEEIAARVGKSVSTVRNLLALRGLPAVAREALERGEIPASTAGVIVRVPGAEAREQVARKVLAGDLWCRDEPPTDAELARIRQQGGPPLTYRQAKDVVRDGYTVELKSAPFSRKSLELLPGAGSCEACPKRAGNLAAVDPEFADVRADVCTDPECYRRKVEAHAAGVVEAQRASGRPVLAGKEAAALFTSYAPHRMASESWVDLGAACHQDEKDRSWQKLVGKQLAGEVTVAVDPAGLAHRLVPARRAREVLEKDHGIRPSRAGFGSSASEERYRREQRARAEKAKAGKAAAREANAAVAARAEAVLGAAMAGGGAEPLGMLRALVAQTCDIAWSEACHQVETRRGARGPGDRRDGSKSRDSVKDLVAAAGSAGELLGIWAELVAARCSIGWGSESHYDVRRHEDGPFWEAFDVDPAGLRKAAAKAAREKKGKGKAKTARGKGKAPAAGAAGPAPQDPTPASDPGRWEREVRDPAAKATEGRRRVGVEGASAEYSVAPLPSGQWAIRWRFDLGAATGSGTPWQAFPTREACLDAFLAAARRYFRDRTHKGTLSTGQERARGRMAKLLAAEPFVEPEPRPDEIEDAAPEKAADIVQAVADGEENPVVKRRLNGIANDLNGVPRGKLKVGARVTWRAQAEQVGVVLSVSKRGGDKEQFFVQWDALAPCKKPTSAWHDAADLVPCDATERPKPAAATWRDQHKDHLDVSAKTRRYLASLLHKDTVGELADWLADANADSAPPAKMRQEILAAIEALKSAAAPTPDTRLVDLTTADHEADRQAIVANLGGRGLSTVRDLLWAATAASGDSPAQGVYDALRSVPGISATTVYEIGDALVDAGLCGAELPAEPWRVGSITMIEALAEDEVRRLVDQGVHTAGDLANHFAVGETLGLKPKLVRQIKEHIEIQRSAGVKIDPVGKAAAAVKARKCRGCGATEDAPDAPFFVQDGLCADCADSARSGEFERETEAAHA